jgi:hypothetical protein
MLAEFNWKRGRVVECTGLENRRRCEPSVSSNLTASAKQKNAPYEVRFFFSACLSLNAKHRQIIAALAMARLMHISR